MHFEKYQDSQGQGEQSKKERTRGQYQIDQYGHNMTDRINCRTFKSLYPGSEDFDKPEGPTQRRISYFDGKVG
jgi:hypothetical protein